MLINEELYDRIQRYLDQEMSVEEARAFEGAMAEDEALAKEVALNRDMQAMLGKSPENELLTNLEILSGEVEDIPSSSGTSWRPLLWFIPVVLFIGWLVFAPGSDNDQESQVQTPVEQPENVPSLDESTSPEEAPIQEEETEEVEAKKEVTPVPPDEAKKPEIPTKPIKKQTQKSQPIAAADFEPNPSLDFLIANNVRNIETVLTVQQQQQDIKLAKAGDEVPFELKAQFESEVNLSDKNFKLHLFSNKKADFDNFEPMFTFDLSLLPGDENIYKVAISQNLNIQPGLYYYLIEDYETEKIYYVEKFEVRLK
jgi:hypothetical protein